ncbi:GNAT family N-acetyltransferase [Umboniibacter marinipuniceus]|uniref:Acetyltransferase (GNAT) family protein n=1 Tax=Umboniibacter marinipuniceus TaxID=569599 RepID=A0A3M0A8M4_9GAMM|nr:GNAT family N-acetyltransferase [Umboniibacter marinipuniceus]RMA80966.1 acetyltransferase (GNAT) family protein [Umboniibacter marinipuniceus]
MNLQLCESKDLAASAQLSLTNMQPYYDMYGVEWGVADIHRAISELLNYDIVSDHGIVGAVRLSFDGAGCQLRDIQIADPNKGKGFGAKIIGMIRELAVKRGMERIELKVFQRSPAVHLYLRCGFVQTEADERFFFMRLNLP